MIERLPSSEAVGGRVDAWLSGCYPEVSRAVIRKLIDDGALTVDGRRCAKGDRVVAGVVYRLAREPHAAVLSPNPALPLDVLYEDEALLAVRKPAARDCQPNAPEETDTLANALLARHPELAGVGDGPLTCGILHRIDRETSGLVLVAKSQEVYDTLRGQFTAHRVIKCYLALVLGRIQVPARLEHLLAHNPRCPGRMINATEWHDAKRPMHAITEYCPVRGLSLAGMECTLLNVTIRTGVTHQIRAQLSFSGHPIIGDRRYGGFLPEGFPRHFLHAHSATFRHPVTNAEIRLEAPLTNELYDLLKQTKTSWEDRTYNEIL